MKKLEKLIMLFGISALASTLILTVKAQTPDEAMKTFFDSEIPGIKIQVNATAETQPTKNITVILNVRGLTDVNVEYFNLSIFGFVHGKDKVLMANITDTDFSLGSTSKKYNRTFIVPENVWDVTYGEILLTYTTKLGGLELTYRDLILGFTMTHVENVYLKAIEEQLQSLGSTYEQLNQTFWENFQMNLTAENIALLNQTLRDLQGSQTELNNTRTAVIVLAITSIFFVATTLYMIIRKPKQYL